MELKYYTFPGILGKWIVAKFGELKSYPVDDGTRLYVEFVNGIPVHASVYGTVYGEAHLFPGQVEDNLKAVHTPEGQLQPSQKNAWDTQVGGGHYTDMKIQPFEFSMANKLDPMQHTIVKYVTRFRAKNGIQDLEKARHVIDLLIEWEKKQCN